MSALALLLDSPSSRLSSMPVEVEFISALEAPPAVVWDRVVRVAGANDELWPLAKMTRPSVADRLTAPGHGGLPPFRSWFLLFVGKLLGLEHVEDGVPRRIDDAQARERTIAPDVGGLAG
ncbi:MAG: hypothetical protein ACXVKA_04630 [Acidimicrobiia bacterium]